MEMWVTVVKLLGLPAEWVPQVGEVEGDGVCGFEEKGAAYFGFG